MIKKRLNTLPKHFDLNCEYLEKYNFDSDLSFTKQEYDARLWIKELWLNEQVHVGNHPVLQILILAAALCILPVSLDKIFIKLEIEDENELPDFYWLYNISAWGFTWFFYTVNILFLFVAYNDANRRNAGMQRLSQSLEFDFHQKDSISIRLPVINFLESKSLLSWLAARKIVLDMGFRFELRV